MKIKQLICMALAAAVLLPAAVCAATLSEPFFYDFEDCTAEGNYGVVSSGEWQKSIVSGKIDDKHGVSLLFNIPESGSTPYINISASVSRSAVIGFSAYTDENTSFTFGAKGNSGSWGKPDSAAEIINFKSGVMRGKDGSQTECENGWNSFCIGLDYTNHVITVWVNGEKASVYQAAEQFTATSYFNVNSNRVSGEAQIAFDDMYAYYPAEAKISCSPSGIVEPDTSLFTVNLGQRAFCENRKAAVKIYDKNNTVISGEAKKAQSSGFADTIEVPLCETLAEGGEYTLEISGVFDALGNEIKSKTVFSVRDTSPKVVLKSEETRSLPAGTLVEFGISSQNLPEEDILEVYLNNEKVSELEAGAEKFEIALTEGENRITVKSVLTQAASQEYTLTAGEYDEIKSCYSGDFETEASMKDFKMFNAGGSIGVIDYGGEHGNVLELKTANSDMPYFILPAVIGIRGIIVYEGDFCFGSLKNRNIFPVKSENNIWFQSIREVGSKIQVFGKDAAEVETDTWYSMKAMYDTVSNKVSFFMDGRVYAFEEDMGVSNYTGIQYCNQNSGTGTEGSPSVLYVDNLKEYVIAKKYKCSIYTADNDGNECDRLPYSGGKVKIKFSEPMNEKTLDAIALADKSGSVQQTRGSYDSGENAYIIETGTLAADTEYTVIVPDTVRTAAGAGGENGSFAVITEKQPFCIDSVSISEAGDKADIRVNLRDISEDGHIAAVIVCIYEGDRLYSVKVIDADTSASVDYKAELNIPHNGYSTEVYLVDSLETMRYIHMYCE